MKGATTVELINSEVTKDFRFQKRRDPESSSRFSIPGSCPPNVRLPPSESDHGATPQIVRRHPVTDPFLGGGHGLADGAADELQDRLHVFRVTRDVFV